MTTCSSASTTRGRGPSFWTGSTLTFSLAAALLVISAFQSLATFFIRMYGSDVMLGVVQNFTLFSRATWNVVVFAFGLVLVHGLFALAVQILSYVTAIAWPSTGKSRNGLVVIWFSFLLATVLLQNAAWFPRSNAGSYYHAFAVSRAGPLSIAEVTVVVVTVLAGLTLAVAATRIVRSRPVRIRRAGVLTAAVVLPAAAMVATYPMVGATGTAQHFGPPNVVIIGIDSLRLKNLRRFGGIGATPHLDDELQHADIFRDAITPLARTFPSWMSILSGREPRSTGALFNLVQRSSIRSEPNLAGVLRNHGYSTYYVTDEVRFSNINESYGFDHVVTPPIGAADFLVGNTADLPLSNVVANSALGGALLGYLNGNRAVAGLYRPSTFLARVDREFNPSSPVFLALHLTAAHWPYIHADTPLPEGGEVPTLEGVYLESLKTADSMFGQVMQMLRRKGVLDNALVVILSDHGEALAMPDDGLVGESLDGRVQGLRAVPKLLNSGHGQSVLSPVQYEVLLAFRAFGRAAGSMRGGRDFLYGASLEDVMPTVLDVVKVPRPAVDGMSLAAQLSNPSASSPEKLPDRIRFTETDIRVAPSADGTFDEDAAAAQAARLFAVDTSTGWLHLRSQLIPLLMMFKERAAISDRLVLAAMPVAPGRHEYLLLDRRSGKGRVLDGRPMDDDEPAAVLWDALHEHFAGELGPAITVGPDEQTHFDVQWTLAATQFQASLPGT